MEEWWIGIMGMGGWLSDTDDGLVRRRRIERDELKLGGRRGHKVI